MNDQPTNPKMLVLTRSTTHGYFPDQAKFYEAVMAIWRSAPNWEKMPAYMRYEIEYETKKMARIACGDFMFMDHWADRGGYIQLVVDELLLLHKENQSRSKPWSMPAADVSIPGTPEDGGHHSKQEDPPSG